MAGRSAGAGGKTRRRRLPRIQPGAAPGTIRSDPSAAKTVIRVMAYDTQRVIEKVIADPGELRSMLDEWPVVWVNVDGLSDTGLLRSVGEIFGLHRLALEDVVNVGQRAKVEPYDDHLFVVVRMCGSEEHVSEQLSLFLGQKYVLTFQERPGDCFDPVRKRISEDPPRAIRRSGPDYLAYALLDAVIDSYFPVLESIGDRLESLEDEALGSPEPVTAHGLQKIKRQLREMRRASWPHRDVASALLREENRFITQETRIYLRDCLDHAIQVTDLVSIYLEVATDLVSLHLSSVSNKMNEVMKVLTLVASIFIPLGFLAGLYGMNFNPEVSPLNMPELNSYWGYPTLLVVMVVLAVGMLVLFRRKGWM